MCEYGNEKVGLLYVNVRDIRLGALSRSVSVALSRPCASHRNRRHLTHSIPLIRFVLILAKFMPDHLFMLLGVVPIPDNVSYASSQIWT